MGVRFPRRSNERGLTRPRCGFASFYSFLVQIENDSHACIGRDARARDRASSVAGALLKVQSYYIMLRFRDARKGGPKVAARARGSQDAV